MLRRHLFLVVATLVCCALDSPAQPARIFGDSDKLAIEQMYSRYLQAFVKKDYTTLRESVQAPFVVLAGGEMQTLESSDAVLTFYRSQLESLESVTTITTKL